MLHLTDGHSFLALEDFDVYIGIRVQGNQYAVLTVHRVELLLSVKMDLALEEVDGGEVRDHQHYTRMRVSFLGFICQLQLCLK